MAILWLMPICASAATFTATKNLSFGTLIPTTTSGSATVSLNSTINTNSTATVAPSGTAYYAGLDTQVTVFGDDYGKNHLSQPGARITAGRTMLEPSPRLLNLVRFQAGDIVSAGNNLFYNGVAGRGILLSSFKDLVISADKTIDITGPMAAGWNAELHLNNQLIGFRQSGIDGRYEFKNIPVNYGLNDFKVVLYGPYGEVREE